MQTLCYITPDILHNIWFLSILHIFVWILVCSHCLKTRREPTSSLLWMFIAWVIPLFGPVLYITMGIYRVPAKIWHKAESDNLFNTERASREQDSMPLSYWRSLLEGQPAEVINHTASIINHTLDGISPHNPLLSGNSAQFLAGGDEFFPALFEDISNARNHIHIQSYIIGNDSLGRKLLDLLEQRAREGIRVRVLYDQFGSSHAIFTGLFRKRKITDTFSIYGFTQVNPLRSRFQINLMNHRKIAVIDGTTGYTGGINFHREHTRQPGKPSIRDYHFRLEGPIVHELQYTFLRDWYYMTDENADTLLSSEHFPAIPHSIDHNVTMRLVNGGPTSVAEPISDLYLTAITGATRQILAVTPYFVPPPGLLGALRVAALRGVDVRLLTPRISNHFTATFAGRAVYDDILRAGVRIFESPPPLLHIKALIIDDSVTVVGSANLDNRSLKLNYETNLVIFDDPFSEKIKKEILQLLQESSEINIANWERRPRSQQIIENFCYLMSPIL